MTMSLLTWNLAWKARHSRSGRILADRIAATGSDVACLTETMLDFPAEDGHVIAAEENYGYRIVPGRRKALLWSRNPWRKTDCVGSPDLPPGRFVRGETETSIGAVTVVGICIPWSHAHVTGGRRDRAPWEDHCAYLRHLRPILRGIEGPLIVMGDFNQRIPRMRGNAHAEALLHAALGPLSVGTSGPIPVAGETGCRAAIDHIAHDASLTARAVTGLSNHADGRQLSDHFGVTVTLERVSSRNRHDTE